ncbi:MFS transporter [Actinomyces sp. zg-332]|uniref:MFS transporter n=1 Tax=Actinomyces sp. zg-332 TaxID=2708340 RepID=UPI001420EE64|nr:MFS transporter [Actinomyces sp. zg-332]QPK94186.1 MFS transporter [Actinomyces sp. zg-332]
MKNSDTKITDTNNKKSIFNKQVLSWCLWDLGSAAFNSVVTTFIFTVYLTSKPFGDSSDTSTAVGYGFTIAGFLIALLAPLTGQRADKAGKGTFWLGVNSMIVVACIFGLFFVKPHPSYLLLGIILLSVGNVFAEFAGVNYNAMITRVSNSNNIGLISGIGWGSGYVGGIVLLLILFIGFISPEVGWFGVTSAEGLNVRASMLVAGLWMLLASIPVLLFVPGKKHDSQLPPKVSLFQSYKELWSTLKLIRKEAPQTFLFLAASAVFRDGLAAVFTFGAVIAAGTFGFEKSEVILFGIIANLVAGIATMLFGFFDDLLGPKIVIIVSLICMCISGTCVFIFAGYGPIYFWVFGLILSVFVGPTQSASRTYLARMIPEGKEGEVFGLYATTGRAISFIAPAAFTLFVSTAKSFHSEYAQSWGILGIALILLIGLVMMIFVKGDPKHKTFDN